MHLVGFMQGRSGRVRGGYAQPSASTGQLKIDCCDQSDSLWLSYRSAFFTVREPARSPSESAGKQLRGKIRAPRNSWRCIAPTSPRSAAEYEQRPDRGQGEPIA